MKARSRRGFGFESDLDFESEASGTRLQSWTHLAVSEGLGIGLWSILYHRRVLGLIAADEGVCWSLREEGKKGGKKENKEKDKWDFLLALKQETTFVG